VAPGFIETDMTAGLADAVKDTYRAQIPLGRFGTAPEVAAVVAFLASDAAAYITDRSFMSMAACGLRKRFSGAR